MGPSGGRDLKQQQTASVPSPQQVIDLKAKSNMIHMKQNQTQPVLANPCNKSFVFQMHDQHTQLNQYQTYQSKRPPDNQQLTYTNQTLYYSCRTCGNHQPSCKCSLKLDKNEDGSGADSSYFQSNHDKSSGDLTGRYLRAETQQSNQQRTPPSCSSSSSSVSSMMDGNSNVLTMLDQSNNYEQNDLNKQQQATIRHDQDHQRLYQQMPCHTNQQQQQLAISVEGESLMLAEAHQLTYNYDEQDRQQHQQVSASNWSTNLTLVADQHSENCSSYSNQLHNNNNNYHHQQESLSEDQSFRLANNDTMAPGGQQQQQQQQQQQPQYQQQLSVPQQQSMSQQTYSNTGGLHKMVSPNGNTIDFNNNNYQQHLQQSTSYSNLALLPASNTRHKHGLQDSYSCQTSESGQDTEQEQQHYSASSNNSTNYPPADSSACNKSSSYHQTDNHQHLYQNLNQDSYSDQLVRFEMHKHIQQSSPTQQHQTSNLHFTTYDHLQQMDPHIQTYESHDRTQLKQMAGQFHNEQHQLYYTGISHMPIDNQQQEQQNEYKLPPAQTLVSHYDQSDNQYPTNGNVTRTQETYASLQQLAMNCDSHANQVTTTTITSNRSSQSTNKSRSSKGRRGRPRKKGLRSKNKVNGKLWEFIRDLLLSDRTNPSFIRWERREDGVFKFVQSDKVAKMWGERKQNPKMTYEKLSRAMRYYYKSKVLLPVFGRRLVYKFGPNATGWMAEESSSAAPF